MRRHRADFEHRHRLFHAVRLLVHAFGRRGRLLHQRGVLLGHLVDVADGLVDVFNAGALLVGWRR